MKIINEKKIYERPLADVITIADDMIRTSPADGLGSNGVDIDGIGWD